jgi:hypothetical protein
MALWLYGLWSEVGDNQFSGLVSSKQALQTFWKHYFCMFTHLDLDLEVFVVKVPPLPPLGNHSAVAGE